MHVANHLVALGGDAAHIRLMEVLRVAYRQPVVEAALLACVAFQGTSGLWMLFAGWKRRHGALPWLQAASGAYLAAFLLLHVAAVLSGRIAFGLDTNFHFAAAGFQVPPFQYFFAPYYFMAVVALFTHIGCALSRFAAREARARTVAAAAGLGIVVSSLILASLTGLVHPFEVPAKYKVIYGVQAPGP